MDAINSNSELPQECPVCGKTFVLVSHPPGLSKVRCGVCGPFWALPVEVKQLLANVSAADRAHVMGWIRDHVRLDSDYVVDSKVINAALASPRLTPIERAQRLLLVIARHVRIPGVAMGRSETSFADACAESEAEFDQYIVYLRDNGWLIRAQTPVTDRYFVTVTGWVEVERIQRYREAYRGRAFIAMPFNEADLNEIFTRHWKPACKKAGFDLFRSDEMQTSGLIDDQMRVQIRNARIVICDITHHNQGVYWEAGFAEGVGKPVIFTCEKSVLAGKSSGGRPHFDVAHQMTIPWEKANIGDSVRLLKARIRATLPDEAIMEDVDD